MSLQERLSAQDPVRLLSLGASASLVYSSTPIGVTNFALFLFGVVAHELHSSTVPFRMFLNLVVFSAFFDLIRLPTLSFPSIHSLCAIFVLFLKVPIFLTCLSQLRERGGDLQFGYSNFNFQGLGAPGGGSWAPTAFRGAGQTTGSAPPTAPAPPGSFPSSGGFRLGGDEDDTNNNNNTSGGPPPAPAPGRNGYSTIA